MMFRKNWFVRILGHILSVTLVCLALEAARGPAAATERGGATSAEAAGPEGQGAGEGTFTLRGWRPTAAFINASALADTTDVDFPDDGDGEKHLVRDIAVFAIVAAFVGFFIAEVFLNKDIDEPPSDDDGKVIPSSGLSR